MTSSKPYFTPGCAWDGTRNPPAPAGHRGSLTEPFFWQEGSQEKITNGLARFLGLLVFPHLARNTPLTVLQHDQNGKGCLVSLGFPLQSQLKAPVEPGVPLTGEQLRSLNRCYLAYLEEKYAEARRHWLRFCEA